jgi:hypothetical protein
VVVVCRGQLVLPSQGAEVAVFAVAVVMLAAVVGVLAAELGVLAVLGPQGTCAASLGFRASRRM